MSAFSQLVHRAGPARTAYIVIDPKGYADELEAVIVYAVSHSAAKSHAVRHALDCAYVDARCQRAPKLDGEPPTIEELVMRHGWGVLCRRCAAPMDEWSVESGGAFDAGPDEDPTCGQCGGAQP